MNKWGGIRDVLLYVLSLLIGCFSITYFSEGSFNAGILAFLIEGIIFTYLVLKDGRVMSPLSFFSMMIMSLMVFSMTGAQTDGKFLSAKGEGAFLLSLAITIFFFILNCIFWIIKKQGWKKALAWIVIVFSFLMLFVFALSYPNFHQNFVYSRIFILIFLLFSIFLIKKHKKAWGIVGIIVSLGMFLLSAVLFAGQIYVVEGEEKEAVLGFITPRAEEMFEYYNDGDFENFCKYCGTQLKSDESIKSGMAEWKDVYGEYLSMEDPVVTREQGSYRVQYSILFQKEEKPFNIQFILTGILPDSAIYGFNILKEEQ